MSHLDHKSKVEAKFIAQGYDMKPTVQHLNLRRQVAEELLNAESLSVQNALQTEAAEQLERELEEWRDMKDGLPSPDPEAQAL